MWPKFKKYQINYFRYAHIFCVLEAALNFLMKKLCSLVSSYIFFPVNFAMIIC